MINGVELSLYSHYNQQDITRTVVPSLKPLSAFQLVEMVVPMTITCAPQGLQLRFCYLQCIRR